MSLTDQVTGPLLLEQVVSLTDQVTVPLRTELDAPLSTHSQLALPLSAHSQLTVPLTAHWQLVVPLTAQTDSLLVAPLADQLNQQLAESLAD